MFFGIDEAGYGSFAGSLFVAAVGFSGRTSSTFELFADAKDSKAMKRDDIRSLARRLWNNAEVLTPYTMISAWEIDRLGGYKALCHAKVNIIRWIAKKHPGATVIVDGSAISVPFGICEGIKLEFIPRADADYREVSCASCVAKTLQMEHMGRLHEEHPEYGFVEHNGYGTKKHKAAIKAHGIIPGVHRKSYVKQLPEGLYMRYSSVSLVLAALSMSAQGFFFDLREPPLETVLEQKRQDLEKVQKELATAHKAFASLDFEMHKLKRDVYNALRSVAETSDATAAVAARNKAREKNDQLARSGEHLDATGKKIAFLEDLAKTLSAEIAELEQKVGAALWPGNAG